jgi:hypothetical protein
MSDHNEVPVTSWVLDKVVHEPAENLPWGAAVVYFVAASPVIGAAALGGYAADEINHFVVEPATATLEKLAEITGDAVDAAADDVHEAVDETASILSAVAHSTAAVLQHAEPTHPADGDAGASTTTPDPAMAHDGAMTHADPSAALDPASAGEAHDGAMCHADPTTTPDPAMANDGAMSHSDPASVPDPGPTGDAYDGGICPVEATGGEPGAAMP